MAYSNFDRKGRRKKARRRHRYETAQIVQEEQEMIQAEVKDGVDNSNGTKNRTSNADRN